MRPIYLDEPNLTLPLAASYNTRGITGFTQAITNARDQRKVNSIYEPVTNAFTNKTTLYLTKRPGVTPASLNSFGASTQTAYLMAMAPGSGSTDVNQAFVFSKTGSSSQASGAVTVDLVTTAAYWPSFVDSTLISGVEHVVVQLRSTVVSTQRAFYCSTTSINFLEITDGGFTALDHRGKIEHVDGYSFISTKDKIYNSDLNNLTSWNPANFISRRSAWDVGVGLGRLGSLIISFGMGSMDVFRNAGTAFGSPLEAIVGMAQDYGLVDTRLTSGTRHYNAVLAGRMYWVGTPMGVYSYDGSTVEKVSNPAIDSILAQQSYFFVGEIGFSGRRAIAIGLDLPTAGTQRALLFFPDWKDWFEWSSTIFQPLGSPRFPDVCIGVSSTSHQLWRIATSTQTWRDNGVDYTMTHQFKLPSKGNPHTRMPMFGVKGDTAASTTTSVLNVRFSDDDWQTSTAARPIDMTKPLKRITRCGAYHDRGVYLDHTGNLDCRLEAVVARIE